jgi:hypothetical protein
MSNDMSSSNNANRIEVGYSAAGVELRNKT